MVSVKFSLIYTKLLIKLRCKGRPCDVNGVFLEPGVAPAPPAPRSNDDYTPWATGAEFRLTELLYTKVQMSAGNINSLMDIINELNRANADFDDPSPPPFASAADMYNVIDSAKLGDIPWEAFSVQYDGPMPDNPLPWMTAKYDVWFQNPLTTIENQLANPDFEGAVDYAAKHVTRGGKREYKDLMSGNWAWKQSVRFFICLINSRSQYSYKIDRI
jgi:hypothetical protein